MPYYRYGCHLSYSTTEYIFTTVVSVYLFGTTKFTTWANFVRLHLSAQWHIVHGHDSGKGLSKTSLTKYDLVFYGWRWTLTLETWPKGDFMLPLQRVVRQLFTCKLWQQILLQWSQNAIGIMRWCLELGLCQLVWNVAIVYGHIH